MSTPRLPNYLRSYRKQLGLDQRDVAFLLSEQDGSRVSRHEFFKQEPNLKSALAYEAILGRPIAELFEGTAITERIKIAKRVQKLIRRLDKEPQNERVQRKIETLTRILQAIAPDES